MVFGGANGMSRCGSLLQCRVGSSRLAAGIIRLTVRDNMLQRILDLSAVGLLHYYFNPESGQIAYEPPNA